MKDENKTVDEQFVETVTDAIDKLYKDDGVCDDCKRDVAQHMMVELMIWFGRNGYEAIGMAEVAKIEYTKSLNDVMENEHSEDE